MLKFSVRGPIVFAIFQSSYVHSASACFELASVALFVFRLLALVDFRPNLVSIRTCHLHAERCVFVQLGFCRAGLRIVAHGHQDGGVDVDVDHSGDLRNVLHSMVASLSNTRNLLSNIQMNKFIR